MKLRFAISVLLIAFWATCSGQKPKHYLELANQSIQIEDYSGASFYYLKAYDLDSTNLEIYLNYAFATLKDNNYKKAEFAFEYFYYHHLREGNDEALFYLAISQQYNRRYLQAKKNIQDFLKFAPIDDPLIPKAKQTLKSCEFALENEENEKYFEVTHFEKNINTIHSEVSPVLNQDSLLSFSALIYKDFNYSNQLPEESEPEGIKLFIADLKKENKSTLIDSIFQLNYMHVANFSLMWENKRLITLCDKENSCAIYKATLDSNKIVSVELLPKAINANNSINTQPNFAFIESDTFLLFASNRNGGAGGFDIWASKFSNNQFEESKNLGQRINSPGNELTPYYNKDSSSIFFSSNWHEGYGGFDVFKASGSLENHTFPQNLGNAINSSANDLYFNYTPIKSYGTFVSNRSESYSTRGETCCNDIYFFNHYKEPQKEPKLDTLIEDSIIEIALVNNPLKSNNTNNLTLPKTKFDFSKIATVYFPNDIPKYGVNSQSSNLSYDEILKIYYAQKQEYLAKVGDSSFFEITLKESDQNLKDLKNIIEDFKSNSDTLKITFQGFSSPLASKGYNQNLASRRIDAILKYLNLNAAFPTIKVESASLGERENMQAFLSDIKNEKAIYSKEAMDERKVNIKFEVLNFKK